MKKVILLAAMILSGLSAHATGLNIQANQALLGFDGIDVHLYARPDGSIVEARGRSLPVTLTITNVQDLRARDGNIEFQLSDGSKLVQTSGFSIDHIQHIYLIDPAGKKIEMTGEVTLQAK